MTQLHSEYKILKTRLCKLVRDELIFLTSDVQIFCEKECYTEIVTVYFMYVLLKITPCM